MKQYLAGINCLIRCLDELSTELEKDNHSVNEIGLCFNSLVKQSEMFFNILGADLNNRNEDDILSNILIKTKEGILH